MTLSQAEENYLKALFKISHTHGHEEVGTNELALSLSVKPATANVMLKKLKEKELVVYEKYGKIILTEAGKQSAIDIVRKHRLWESFLYEKLGFEWDEVHEVAEQLEHIHSTKLIESLDKFLNYPAFDPHGDPIPNNKGELKVQFKKLLSDVPVGKSYKMVSVKDNSTLFLQYVVKVGLGINNEITVISKQAYDELIVIEVNGEQSSVSKKFADNIYVSCLDCSNTERCPCDNCDLKT